ncbi:MAG: hypothetical protein M1827_003977 [Pycnora praestabilis]|nr:MAG: hypothetical protein M1827_003977 [Pycnora praestabilis]
MSSPQNVLFQTSILSTNSIVLELGCGISGLVGMLLAPMVNRYIATDQDYVFKLLKQNLSENTQSFGTNPHRKRKSKHARGKQSTDTQQKTQASNVDVMALDWELDSTSTLLDFLSSSPTNLDTIDSTHLDAVIACDCIYNEALVDPFVRTCAEICGLSRTQTNSPRTPVCIVAQQLRSSDVFEAWLTAFHKKFRIWRIPDELLTEGLREGSGFVIHVGVLRRSE